MPGASLMRATRLSSSVFVGPILKTLALSYLISKELLRDGDLLPPSHLSSITLSYNLHSTTLP